MRRKPGEIYGVAGADEDREEGAEQPRYRKVPGLTSTLDRGLGPHD